jgi:hypothetical protein
MMAVNVCLLPPLSVQIAAASLSARVCASSVGTPLEYLLEPLESSRVPRGEIAAHRGIPHATLTQLFLNSADVPDLVGHLGHAKASVMAGQCAADAAKIAFLKGVHEGPVFAEHRGEGVRLPSLAVATTIASSAGAGVESSFIACLHAAVTVVVAPFRRPAPAAISERVDCFAPCWPGNEASFRWVANFPENSSGSERYFPHVTLGASIGAVATQEVCSGACITNGTEELPAVTDASGWTMALCRMGNFCSCNTVIAVI